MKDIISFDDFDLQISFDKNDDDGIAEAAWWVTNQTTANSSTSFCCALATNATEEYCSWCAGC